MLTLPKSSRKCIGIYLIEITCYRKGPGNSDQAVIVTQKVQEAFSRDWEIWGHKQIFAGDPSSFCGRLDRVLGGYKLRPKKGGPYKLVICYKHGGHEFYKEFDYNEKEELVLPSTPSSDKRGLLSANSNNLTFVGEKINMTKDEFIERIKKLPLLAELMRVHISQHATILPKSTRELVVVLKHEKRCVIQVEFSLPAEKKDLETPGISLEKPKYNHNSEDNRWDMQLQCLSNEDLLAEVKSRILEAINVMVSEIAFSNPEDRILELLKPEIFLNHSLQFYDSNGALDDYKRLEDVVTKISLITFREM